MILFRAYQILENRHQELTAENEKLGRQISFYRERAVQLESARQENLSTLAEIEAVVGRVGPVFG